MLIWKPGRSLMLILILTAASLCFACSGPSPQPFDSQKWKSGGKDVRGGMVPDMRDRHLLKDKSKAEVEQLLGKPDVVYGEWGWGYEVVTIARCYFWVCRMAVSFDTRTGKATGEVVVSD
jgi:hypothetical protein